MLHPEEAVMTAGLKASRYGGVWTKAGVSRALAKLARPVGTFNAERYFRGDHGLRFYNVGTAPMRALARSIYLTNRDEWSVDDAMALADRLIADPYLETKSVGIELVARYRRSFTPKLLPRWKRWLARNYSANWATTDAICGLLTGPLLVQHPDLAPHMRRWAADRNLWVRRASIVSLIMPIRARTARLDLAYDVAATLHPDAHDLIHKAVGWTLREAGKVDPARLERYLRANGASIPRTTVRYAIERFADVKRRELLRVTRA
jgi:3-methyladenine DNA glycosylase AlkD